nr:MAG TPA: tail assembly chaperone protein [Caudoviricetes sp.]
MGSVRRFQIVKAPEPTDEELSAQARTERDRKIAKTDYYMMSDYPSNPQNLEELKVYRQALRDVPKQEGFPMDVRWPDVPKFLCKDSELEPLGLAKVGI